MDSIIKWKYDLESNINSYLNQCATTSNILSGGLLIDFKYQIIIIVIIDSSQAIFLFLQQA